MKNELSRRALFRHAACCGSFGLASLALLPARAEAQKKAGLTPEQALARLKNGNVDFLADKAEPSPQDHKRRLEIARGQAPFACFSAARTAGFHLNSVRHRPGRVVHRSQRRKYGRYGGVGQHEYSVLMLGVPLIWSSDMSAAAPSTRRFLWCRKTPPSPAASARWFEPIIPAALKANSAGGLKGDALLDAAVRENVRRTLSASQLRAFTHRTAARRHAQDCWRALRPRRR